MMPFCQVDNEKQRRIVVFKYKRGAQLRRVTFPYLRVTRVSAALDGLKTWHSARQASVECQCAYIDLLCDCMLSPDTDRSNSR